MARQKPIGQLTTQELTEQMSIAGEPQKITFIMKAVLAILGYMVNHDNPAELTNAELAMLRVVAEIKQRKRALGKRIGQKLT